LQPHFYNFLTLKKAHLISRSEIQIRFSDTDALGIVWHGNYIKYFEDGREAFSAEHGIELPSMYNEGFATPIVKSLCDTKSL
jgi:acyl-CoA thioester hydrolase